MELLKKLIEVHSPSGEEFRMRDFLIAYVEENKQSWNAEPALLYGDDFQDNLILVFGKEPKTAVFAHMDVVGFTARYENQLVPIGGPETEDGYYLSGRDALGPIDCRLKVDDGHKLLHDFMRPIQRGTSLVFKPELKISGDYIQGPNLDNRLGIYNALKIAEDLEEGIIVFSSYEEHGGGSVPMLTRYLYEHYQVKKALISDITWVTDGVSHGKGVVISMRDQNIPRKRFVDEIIEIAERSGIPYQLEVESGGSSDGREVHFSPYPIDWCFIGAPEDHVHSPNEKVHISDLEAMIEFYRVLLKNL